MLIGILNKQVQKTGLLLLLCAIFVVLFGRFSYSDVGDNKELRKSRDSARVLHSLKPEVMSPKQMLLADTVSEFVHITNTSSITSRINNGTSECASLPVEYRVDCLAQTFKAASRVAGSYTEYSGPRLALKDGGNQLSSIVTANEDRSAPKLRGKGKTYRAVKKAAVAKVNKRAVAIISETETKLMRSAGSSQKRRSHFSQIAKAVGSTKRILRSA